jgi:hypothetical protein
MAGYGSVEGTVTSTQELARLLVLSERRIQQLERAGVLRHALNEDTGQPRRGKFEFVGSLHNYLEHVRNELCAGDATETRYLEARTRRMLAMAQHEELRLGQTRGQLHRSQGH